MVSGTHAARLVLKKGHAKPAAPGRGRPRFPGRWRGMMATARGAQRLASDEAGVPHAKPRVLRHAGRFLLRGAPGECAARSRKNGNAWGTAVQKAAGVHDSGELFEKDTFASGKGGSCQPELVRTLSDHSAEAIEWLSSFGIPLTALTQLGGASRKRCHRAPDNPDGTPLPIGFTIVRALENYIRTNLSDIVRIETNARLISLMHSKEDDAVVVQGITYATQTASGEGKIRKLQARAVILATGGFSNDHTANSLLQQYAPQLSSFPTTNGVWATGDGVKAARELGVKLVDMDKVQLHPTGLLDPKDPSNRTKYLGPEALRGSGGVLLNKNGERFVNELDLRSVVSQAIIEQNNVYPGSGGSKFAYCVLNEAAAKLFGKNFLGFYWHRLGLFEKVEDVAGLAKLIGCPEENVTATLKEYKELSSKKLHACPLTNKNVFPCTLGTEGPYYVAFVTPSIHYTMGGCLISPSAEMQTIDDTGVTPVRRPILGLFGAGEVTGGVHGGNRLGGNSLLECVVFGRIAGARAAAILQEGGAGLPLQGGGQAG
ncbi:NADH-dependent fumarate reductase, putative [Leishmania panamensis]|uniref:NADH-dependent fumarate reductase, putative n=4 Tax=Leishmania panamensis TaxID=5679 RepID=A0AC62A4R1_LEIPA